MQTFKSIQNSVRTFARSSTRNALKRTLPDQLAKSWVLWLWLAGFAPVPSYADSVPDLTEDNGMPNAVAMIRCYTLPGNILCESLSGAAQVENLTTDDVTMLSDTGQQPFTALLPDNEPSGNTYPARFYYDDYSNPAEPGDSYAPNITCATGTVTQETYSTTVALADGASCLLTFKPPNHTYIVSNVVYTGTLSRSGALYSLTGGTICGAPFSACLTPSPPVSASVESNMALALTFIGLMLIAAFKSRKARKT